MVRACVRAVYGDERGDVSCCSCVMGCCCVLPVESAMMVPVDCGSLCNATGQGLSVTVVVYVCPYICLCRVCHWSVFHRQVSAYSTLLSARHTHTHTSYQSCTAALPTTAPALCVVLRCCLWTTRQAGRQAGD